MLLFPFISPMPTHSLRRMKHIEKADLYDDVDASRMQQASFLDESSFQA